VVEFTRMLKQAGIPSMLHSCGKELRLVEVTRREGRYA